MEKMEKQRRCISDDGTAKCRWQQWGGKSAPPMGKASEEKGRRAVDVFVLQEPRALPADVERLRAIAKC